MCPWTHTRQTDEWFNMGKMVAGIYYSSQLIRLEIKYPSLSRMLGFEDPAPIFCLYSFSSQSRGFHWFFSAGKPQLLCFFIFIDFVLINSIFWVFSCLSFQIGCFVYSFGVFHYVFVQLYLVDVEPVDNDFIDVFADLESQLVIIMAKAYLSQQTLFIRWGIHFRHVHN